MADQPPADAQNPENVTPPKTVLDYIKKYSGQILEEIQDRVIDPILHPGPRRPPGLPKPYPQIAKEAEKPALTMNDIQVPNIPGRANNDRSIS